MSKMALEVMAGNGPRFFHKNGLESATGTILLVRPTQLRYFHQLNEIIP